MHLHMMRRSAAPMAIGRMARGVSPLSRAINLHEVSTLRGPSEVRMSIGYFVEHEVQELPVNVDIVLKPITCQTLGHTFLEEGLYVLGHGDPWVIRIRIWLHWVEHVRIVACVEVGGLWREGIHWVTTYVCARVVQVSEYLDHCLIIHITHRASIKDIHGLRKLASLGQLASSAGLVDTGPLSLREGTITCSSGAHWTGSLLVGPQLCPLATEEGMAPLLLKLVKRQLRRIRVSTGGWAEEHSEDEVVQSPGSIFTATGVQLQHLILTGPVYATHRVRGAQRCVWRPR